MGTSAKSPSHNTWGTGARSWVQPQLQTLAQPQGHPCPTAITSHGKYSQSKDPTGSSRGPLGPR